MSSVVLGVPLDDVTNAGALDVIDALIDDGRASGRTHQITTVNVDFIVNAAPGSDLMRILQHSSLNVADGTPVVWASSMFGSRLSERVAGSDLFAELGAASASRGWRVHVLGGAPGVGDRALKMLLERHPDAQITVDPGPVLADPTDVPDEVLDGIAAIDPDVLCVALGNPKQEYFIDAHRERLGCPVMIGVGGSMDMLVGDRRRAPQWMQRIGAEWIFRALQEPRRLGPRYMGDLRVFVPAIVRKRRQLREYTERGCDLVVHDVDGCLTATPVGDAPSTGGIAPGSAEWSAMLVSDRPVHLDLRGCASLTPTAHAAVCSLVRVARRFDRPVTADGWTDALRESFDSYGTREWIDRVLAAPPVTDADAQPHPSPRTIEMTRQWTQN